jgi:hypothetical protein
MNCSGGSRACIFTFNTAEQGPSPELQIAGGKPCAAELVK